MEKISNKYLEYFEKKDTKSLENIFSDDIFLIDWELNVLSKKNVIEAFNNIFNKFENINVSIKEIYCDNKRKTTFVESELTFNNEIKLKVIDILTFNDKNKLCGIKAYKM
tara:strand:- start:79 stop:408 length:330 start_codon:yes stop_codon:yes gene_type:complete